MATIKPPNTTIASEIESLAALDLEALRATWRHHWGEAPGYRSRDLLGRALAYKIQAEAFGDLPAPAQRRATELAERFTQDRSFTPSTVRAFMPGSSLIREWHGTRHEVAVIDDGFLYQGAKFRSLSKVAQRITGTKWNGPVFFGMKRKGAAT